uniref:hypothetical protein n=1 Tax=uncultured Draconibacterium sp. TaxID=1573823 RepID=UPI003216C510
MKRILSLTGILALALLLSSAISFHQSPQDPPRTKRMKKHIKMVRADDKGKTVEIDTVMNVDEVLIWNGDTIDGGKAMKWVSKEDFDMDFDFDIEEDGDGNVFIMKSGKTGVPMLHGFKMDGDSANKYRLKIIADDPVGPHKMMFMSDRKKGNVIDLSDPGIISFEKKELKNGQEKITIIRKKPSEEDVEFNEEIFIKGTANSPAVLHGNMPHKTKQISVFADDDGKIEILEDGKVWSVEEMNEGTKVIEKDGKKIIIKKRKQGGEMKVDVEVGEEIKEE